MYPKTAKSSEAFFRELEIPSREGYDGNTQYLA
jgi:hypothetical protein